MATRNAALKLDWSKMTTSLGLRGQTATSLQAFKKRHDEAKRKVQALSELPTTVDFAAYRAQLKNQAVVDDVLSKVQAFKPKSYDVSRQLKAIEAFEADALRDAHETEKVVQSQLADLNTTLTNIEKSRPVEDLVADDVASVEPRIDDKVKRMLKKGKWDVPGYEEKFGKLSLM